MAGLQGKFPGKKLAVRCELRMNYRCSFSTLCLAFQFLKGSISTPTLVRDGKDGYTPKVSDPNRFDKQPVKF